MSDGLSFADAATAFENATGPSDDLCRPFVSALHVSGAAVSTLGDPVGTETICASDDLAARLDEIQIDLGEGPCWDALSSRRPVLESDVQGSEETSWPLARKALQETGLGAVFAFPLIVAAVKVGAVDLYCTTARELTPLEIDDARVLAGILGRHVLRRALLSATGSEHEKNAEGDFSRREVHQATGMILAQMGVAADDAQVMLRGHAFAMGRSVRDVAADVVARRLDFTYPDN